MFRIRTVRAMTAIIIPPKRINTFALILRYKKLSRELSAIFADKQQKRHN